MMIRSTAIAAAVMAIGISNLLAEPITPDRIAALPAAEQSAWHDYLSRSQAAALNDQNALQAELAANSLPAALAAPDGGDFKLPAKAGEPYYTTPDAKALGDIILSYQTPAGGWSKHTGYARGARKPGMLWSSQYKPGEKPHYLATFDNRSTTEQLHFLANLTHATKDERYKAAFLKGLDYILAAQYPNGGWPQVYPLEGKYHDNITFNDDAMTHVISLLFAIESGEPYYAFVDEARRTQVAAALQRGIACVLKLQIEQNGKKAVWCAQNDPISLQPTQARAMEPATLSGGESARLLGFLMKIKKPSPEVVAAIEGGLAWLAEAKVTGFARKQGADGKTVYEPDPASTEVYWARFYDLKTGRPVFPGRDGVIYDSYNAMAAKNPVGYDYYITQPGSLLNVGQSKWRKMVLQQGGE